jgi:hypothetical protein
MCPMQCPSSSSQAGQSLSVSHDWVQMGTVSARPDPHDTSLHSKGGAQASSSSSQDSMKVAGFSEAHADISPVNAMLTPEWRRSHSAASRARVPAGGRKEYERRAASELRGESEAPAVTDRGRGMISTGRVRKRAFDPCRKRSIKACLVGASRSRSAEPHATIERSSAVAYALELRTCS